MYLKKALRYVEKSLRTQAYAWPSKVGILFSLLFFLSLTFAYGVYVGVYKAFPFDYVQALKQFIAPSPLANERNGESRVKQFEYLSAQSDIVFVGGSITEGAIWGEFLSQYEVANRGVRGDTTSDILLRVDSILSVKPKVIFIMVGINDIYRAVPIENIFENYSILIDRFVESGAEVIVQSTVQCEMRLCGEARVEKVNELNKLLKSVSAEKGFMYLGLKALSDRKGLKKSFTTDGVHLTVDAYAYWLSLVLSELKKLKGF
jgi:lysophospholipase L1-like esterase